eukprot:GHVS01002061.1.p1 GENE.GHVS01002061.1~~GHVS01002061.1.p1  ORF type:complete len:224 (+),score=20.54 GHVS01002061.1:3-674(+)
MVNIATVAERWGSVEADKVKEHLKIKLRTMVGRSNLAPEDLLAYTIDELEGLVKTKCVQLQKWRPLTKGEEANNGVGCMYNEIKRVLSDTDAKKAFDLDKDVALRAMRHFYPTTSKFASDKQLVLFVDFEIDYSKVLIPIMDKLLVEVEMATFIVVKRVEEGWNKFYIRAHPKFRDADCFLYAATLSNRAKALRYDGHSSSAVIWDSKVGDSKNNDVRWAMEG